MTIDVFIPDEQKNQYEQKNQSSEPVKTLRDFGLDHSSLPLLIEVIDALENDRMFGEASTIIDNLAEHQQISQFVRTLFKHAQDGFVQLRMFIDDKDRGGRESLYGYPWRAVHVGDLDKLAVIAAQAASIAARSPEKVNFCPPVATFTGTDKAAEEDLCQGLTIMVELDEQPDQSRHTLESLLGRPTLVVKSGGTWTEPKTGEVQERCHLYWRLSQPVSGNDARLKQCRTWASDLVSSDPTGRPVNHPLRWPGSWHKKGEPRLCRISEINETVEIEFEAAYAILKQAAAKAGLRVEHDEVRPRERHVTNPNAHWYMDKPGPQAILATYLSRTCNRRSALMGFASGIAMSAVHAGYDLSISELAGIVEDAHHANPSTSKRTRKEFIAIAKDAQDWANQHVSQPAHIKKDEWEAYLRSETDRIDREIRADDEADGEAVRPKGPAAKNGDAGDLASGDDDPDKPAKSELHHRKGGYDAEGGAPKPRKRFYSSADCRVVKPPKWQVEGLIPENADVAIYGVSGTLKSFVALDLAMSVATALNAFGIMEIKEAKPVFYFAGEGFHNIIKKRQVAWQLHRGLEPYSTGNLWFVDGVPLVNNESGIEADIQEMVRLLDDRPLGVFVIDTLSRALNGEDEDRSNSASRYFARLHQIRAACGGGTSITVGHFGKDADRGERGSSNFRASFDTVVWIEKHHKDDDTGIHTIQLWVVKQKDSDDGKRIWLQSRPVDVPVEDGETRNDHAKNSLVLMPISEVDGRRSSRESRPSSSWRLSFPSKAVPTRRSPPRTRCGSC
jgi:hypothetical protein